MTATASSNGKVFMDCERLKNQEWLRRRKIRLEQVRKQSQDIAKALRQKVVNEEKLKNEIYQKVKEVEFRDWKAERLAHLENKLRYALEEFGEGYKLAQAEPDPNKIIQERKKINETKAQERGEIAYHRELKVKKMEEEKKMSPIRRKLKARKMEDLRSALVCSVPVRKQLSEKWDVPAKQYLVNEDKALSFPKINRKRDQVPKSSVKKGVKTGQKVKKSSQKVATGKKTCACKNKTSTSVTTPSNAVETIWINLNNIQNSSRTGESRSAKSTPKTVTTKTSEGVVEFYDFPSRYFCKSYKEFPHLVKKIEPSGEPDAVELSKMDEAREQEEIKRRQEVEAVTQERGYEALRREKLNREYQNMIGKLEGLNKKEKVLKSQTRILPSVFHMTDERLTERSKTRQKLMDSKFESIYYSLRNNTSPQREFEHNIPGSGDYIDVEETGGPGLSFSAMNLKPNSPVIQESEELTSHSQKNQILLDIEKTLREGRELRKSASRTCESETESEKTMKADRSVQASPFEGTKSQESQTYGLHSEVKMDDSLPRSTSTSYKSPPTEIKSTRMREFLDYLDFQSDNEETSSDLKQELRKLSVCLEREGENTLERPTLEYYIKKLLSMSRECIANLNVSSENISTPCLSEFNARHEKVDLEETFPKKMNFLEKSRMERVEVQTELNTNWKNILERNPVKSERSEPEDEPDGEVPDPEEFQELQENSSRLGTEERPFTYCSQVQQQYELITRKCSERISELTNLLEKIREDKEKFVVISGKSSDQEEDDVSFRTEESEKVESQCCRDESLESWPDVMNELLRKGMLTSPFKWDSGHLVTENDKPTIDVVIENFRKEMDKILQRHQTRGELDDFHFESFQSCPKNANDLQGKGIPKLCFSGDSDFKPTVETVIGNFRKEMNKIKPKSIASIDSYLNSTSRMKEVKEFECTRESSEESINRALSNLGLNWAKSFLRKNEKSRAMSSSSEDAPSEDEGNV